MSGNKMKLILLIISCFIAITHTFDTSKKGSTEIYLVQNNKSFTISSNMNFSNIENLPIQYESLGKNQFYFYILRQDWIDRFYNEGIFSTDCLTITFNYISSTSLS